MIWHKDLTGLSLQDTVNELLNGDLCDLDLKISTNDNLTTFAAYLLNSDNCVVKAHTISEFCHRVRAYNEQRYEQRYK